VRYQQVPVEPFRAALLQNGMSEAAAPVIIDRTVAVAVTTSS
jgi:hypothetical protein